LSFGAYPDISLVEARQRREEARSLLAHGVDPSATKKAQKVADTQETETFEVIAREWHEKFAPSWADYLDRLMNNEKSETGKKFAEAISI